MFFKVKEDARFKEYTALGGLTFTKKSVTNVPEPLVDAARLLDFLEEAGAQVPPGLEEDKQKVDEKFMTENSGKRPEEVVEDEKERLEGKTEEPKAKVKSKKEG